MLREIVEIDAAAVVPDVRSVLAAQGIPRDVEPNWRTMEQAEKAEETYRLLAQPVGVWTTLDLSGFETVLEGEGRSAASSPAGETARKADSLALFVVTVGADLTRAIGESFERQDPAQGAMLDAYASEGVELVADRLQKQFLDRLAGGSTAGSDLGVLRYSPGYCGWHVSGQKRLFAWLEPQEIGITLRESCLMEPLKSVSGVLIVGPKEIFDFDNDYDFCEECADWICRERIAVALGEQ